MAAQAVRQPVKRSSHRAPRRRSTAARPNLEEEQSSSTSDEEEIVIDVDKIRMARREYYRNASEYQLEADRSAAMPKSGEEGSHRKRRTNRGSPDLDKRDGRLSSHPRRRKRKSKEAPIKDADAEYVYRSVYPPREASEPPDASRRRNSASPTRRASALPKRVEILRTIGLQPPVRTSSERTVRRQGEDTGRRRHSYQEGAIPKSVRPVRDTSRRQVRPRRSQSLRETAAKTPERTPISRSQTTPRLSQKVAPILPTVPEKAVKSQAGAKLGRSGSIIDSIFGPPRAGGLEKKITCLTCGDDEIPISKSAKLACTHRMCHSCLKRIFKMSVKDPAHMPPKCCTQDCIPLKHVDKLFDNKFKSTWNRKYQEFTTKNRIYCPAKGCGSWIPPKQMKTDATTKRKQGICGRCKTKVCASCNGKWHGSRACQSDEETERFQVMAKEEGWQRCYNCSATVELKEGCNHMTCRCTAEFCMICGAKWKSCDCPWFNYASVEADRLEHMNVAQFRREPILGNAPRAYQEELEQRREQERRDEEMARRLQNLDIDLNLGAGRLQRNHEGIDDGHGGRIFPVGNAPGPFMNTDFVNRATNILTGTYDPAARAAATRLVEEIRRGQRVGGGAELDQPPQESPLSPNQTSGPALRRANTGPRRPMGAGTGVGVRPVSGREAERLLPRRPPADFVTEAARYAPAPVPAPTPPPPSSLEPNDSPSEAPAATLAGLQRRTTTGRVDAWRRHVS